MDSRSCWLLSTESIRSSPIAHRTCCTGLFRPAMPAHVKKIVHGQVSCGWTWLTVCPCHQYYVYWLARGGTLLATSTHSSLVHERSVIAQSLSVLLKQWVKWLVCGWRTPGSEIGSRQVQVIRHFCKTSRLVLAVCFAPTQWVLGPLTLVVKRWNREFDHSSPSSAQVVWNGKTQCGYL